MCFRPSAVEMGAAKVTCPACGKQINPVMGNYPDACPFCKTDIRNALPDKLGAAPASASPAPPPPGAPRPPSAPGA